MKILLADDNMLTRSMIKDLLTEMGHEIVGEADNGDETVRMYCEKKPQLVLLDLIMPVKNGMEALQEIIAKDPSAKVIMLTAVQQDPITKELLEKGASGVLHKPFMYGELEEIISRLK